MMLIQEAFYQYAISQNLKVRKVQISEEVPSYWQIGIDLDIGFFPGYAVSDEDEKLLVFFIPLGGTIADAHRQEIAYLFNQINQNLKTAQFYIDEKTQQIVCRSNQYIYGELDLTLIHKIVTETATCIQTYYSFIRDKIESLNIRS